MLFRSVLNAWAFQAWNVLNVFDATRPPGKQKALLKTKREHFKTVYRNMSSIEKELNIKASGLSEGIDSTIPNMLQVGGAADPRLFVPQALPAKIDDFDRKSSASEVRAVHVCGVCGVCGGACVFLMSVTCGRFWPTPGGIRRRWTTRPSRARW